MVYYKVKTINKIMLWVNKGPAKLNYFYDYMNTISKTNIYKYIKKSSNAGLADIGTLKNIVYALHPLSHSFPSSQDSLQLVRLHILVPLLVHGNGSSPHLISHISTGAEEGLLTKPNLLRILHTN